MGKKNKSWNFPKRTNVSLSPILHLCHPWTEKHCVLLSSIKRKIKIKMKDDFAISRSKTEPYKDEETSPVVGKKWPQNIKLTSPTLAKTVGMSVKVEERNQRRWKQLEESSWRWMTLHKQPARKPSSVLGPLPEKDLCFFMLSKICIWISWEIYFLFWRVFSRVEFNMFFTLLRIHAKVGWVGHQDSCFGQKLG